MLRCCPEGGAMSPLRLCHDLGGDVAMSPRAGAMSLLRLGPVRMSRGWVRHIARHRHIAPATFSGARGDIAHGLCDVACDVGGSHMRHRTPAEPHRHIAKRPSGLYYASPRWSAPRAGEETDSASGEDAAPSIRANSRGQGRLCGLVARALSSRSLRVRISGAGSGVSPRETRGTTRETSQG